jgi:hypothetical protein
MGANKRLFCFRECFTGFRRSAEYARLRRKMHDPQLTLTDDGDAKPGAIVEARAYEDANGRRRLSLATRSDFTVEDQATASGATWLTGSFCAGASWRRLLQSSRRTPGSLTIPRPRASMSPASSGSASRWRRAGSR